MRKDNWETILLTLLGGGFMVIFLSLLLGMGYLLSPQYERRLSEQRLEQAPAALAKLGELGQKDFYLGGLPFALLEEFGGKPSYLDAVVLSCEGEDSCSIPEPGSGMSVYLTVLTPSGEEKWQVTHGALARKEEVRDGYKLVSCFCDQGECLVHSPKNSVYITEQYLRVAGKYSFRGLRVFYKE